MCSTKKDEVEMQEMRVIDGLIIQLSERKEKWREGNQKGGAYKKATLTNNGLHAMVDKERDLRDSLVRERKTYRHGDS